MVLKQMIMVFIIVGIDDRIKRFWTAVVVWGQQSCILWDKCSQRSFLWAGNEAMDQSAWKLKYYRSLDELDEKQRAWSETEALLKKALSRVSLAAAERDPDLDPVLDQFRRSIKTSSDRAELARQVGAVSKAVVALDGRIQEGRGRLQRVVAELTGAISSRCGGFKNRRTLKKLSKFEPRYDEDVIAFLEKLTKLLESILDPVDVAEPAEPAEREPRSVESVPVESVPVESVPVESVPVESVVEEASSDAMAPEEDLGWAREKLLSLVQQLHIPAELETLAGEITERIRQGVDLESLALRLDDILGLITRTRKAEKRHLEAFADALAKRLGEVEQVLGVAGDNEQNVQALHDELHADMTGKVSRMRSRMHNVREIDELRGILDEQLTGVVQRLDRFRDDNDARRERHENRLSKLSANLTEARKQANTLQEKLDRQKTLGMTDALTQIGNRHAYDLAIQSEMERATRYGSPLCLIVCDVDHFKKVNDTLGHLAGDKVLRAVAKILQNRTREPDFVARYGGEEFAVIMPGIDVKEAVSAAQKLRIGIAKCPFENLGKPVRITISFGVTQWHSGEDAEVLFERTDQALYQAKKEGRNRVVQA